MQDKIAILLAVLGTLLVVAGAFITVIQGATAEEEPLDDEAPRRRRRFRLWIKSLRPADRLIGWGVVLLLLAAVASGAIAFNIGAEAGTKPV
jgi:drug/metabolite transporter (DMT)-like permease